MRSTPSKKSLALRKKVPQASMRKVAPLVSIITPSFNQGRFLRRTIESVLGQDYPNIEYIIIDGGSTDGSVEIMESYGKRLTWISEPDRGQAHAINKGISRSKGTIISYLNSDDTLCRNAISVVVDHFMRHPQTDLLYGKGNYIDENDAVTGSYPTADYSVGRLMVDCCICQPAAFWTNSITRRVGLFDEQLQFVMDYDYWLRIEKADRIIEHIPVFLGNTRIYPETKTASKRAEIFEEIFQTTRKHGGYVGGQFVEWYWHERLWARPGLFEKLIRNYPTLKRRLIEADVQRLATNRGTWTALALQHLASVWRKVFCFRRA
jgi:glycosyltransferase involved in cell wall biosynthesis